MTNLLLHADIQSSVLLTLGGKRRCYLPYGTSWPACTSRLGYVGVYLEPVAALQVFGNGCRAYSSCLMRFTSQDRRSPFDKGGINAYGYCLANPVNRADRSGQFSTTLIAPLLSGAINAISLGALAALQIDKQPKGRLRRGTQLGALAAIVGLGGAVWRLVELESKGAQIMMWTGTAAGIAAAGYRSLHYLSGIKAQKLNLRQASSRLAGLLPRPWMRHFPSQWSIPILPSRLPPAVKPA